LKKYKNFTRNNLCHLLPIQNISKSNPNTIVNLTPNLTGSFLTLLTFCEDVSFCKHRTWEPVQNLPNFLPQYPHMKSWHLDKSHDFYIFFAIFKILKPFGHTFLVVLPEQNIWNSFSFYKYGLKPGRITWISFLYAFFQVFESLAVQISLNSKNCLKHN
jgi:hypothetical protein